MRSEVILSRDVAVPVFIARTRAEARARAVSLFKTPGVLIIDEPELGEDFDLLQKHLVKKRRKFETPAQVVIKSPTLKAELTTLERRMDDLFRALYEPFNVRMTAASWRPIISGPEPMHYDSFDPHGGAQVCSFFNVDSKPREYRVGYGIAELARKFPEARTIFNDCGRRTRHFSCVMRNRWVENWGPLDQRSPYHQVSLAPGAVWFFDPKTVCHQLFYGRGVFLRSWMVTNSGAMSQDEAFA